MGENLEPRIVVAVNAPKNDEMCVTFLQGVIAKSTNNANLPNAPLGPLTAATAAYAGAVTAFSTQKGTKQARAKARRAALDALDHFADWCVGVAQQAPAGSAAAILESAGLRAKTIGKLVKQPFNVKQGPLSGTALLIALAVARDAFYFWEFSTDQKNWVDWPGDMHSSTIVTGLTAGTTYWFRFRARTRKQLTDWSPARSLLVT